MEERRSVCFFFPLEFYHHLFSLGWWQKVNRVPSRSEIPPSFGRETSRAAAFGHLPRNVALYKLRNTRQPPRFFIEHKNFITTTKASEATCGCVFLQVQVCRLPDTLLVAFYNHARAKGGAEKLCSLGCFAEVPRSFRPTGQGQSCLSSLCPSSSSPFSLLFGFLNYFGI